MPAKASTTERLLDRSLLKDLKRPRRPPYSVSAAAATEISLSRSVFKIITGGRLYARS